MSVLIYYFFSKAKYNDLKNSELKDKKASIEMTLMQSGEYLTKFARDYTIWDAFADYIKTKNDKWLDDNINTLISTKQIQYYWIFDSKYNLVNSDHDADVNGLKFPTSKDILANNARVFHFYIKENNRIIDIAGASIHSAKDPARKTAPLGYFFIGSFLDSSKISNLGSVTNSKAFLSTDTSYSMPCGQFQRLIFMDLKGVSSEPIARIFFVMDDNVEKSEAKYNLIILCAYAAFIIVFLAFAYFAIEKILSSPLRQIIRSLKNENPDELKSLINRNDEFKIIASQINDSFEQKHKIESQYQLISEQNEKLEELNATKDKFFSIIAHDLRNPFGVILSTTEFLANPDYELTRDEIIDFSKDINHTARMLFNLLENLLTWARSQRGTVAFEPTSLDAKELIETTRFVVDSQAESKNIKFEYEIEDDLVCFGDRNMLLTVLRNLTTNAIKFTKNEGKIILGATSINTNTAQFFVKDDGVGISPENIQKLFRIDVNVTTIGTSEEKGTGLGLILCKEFVNKNSGEIRVESVEGKGSNFIFTIPKAV
jgi:signal transduction histidine kinase